MNRHQDKGLKMDAVLGQEAMAEYAGQLAAQLSVNDRTRLRLKWATPLRLGRLGDQAGRLAVQSATQSPAMEWLTGNIRWVEECARAVARERTRKLPARDGAPRVEVLVRQVVAHSDAQVTGERLTLALTAFDRVQGLNMNEIWLAPLALRMALLEAFYTVGLQVVRDQRARLDAENWVAAGARVGQIKGWPGSAFCERALKLLHEQESPGARRALEEWLDSRGGGSETVIRRAHERQAMNRLVLSNILSSLRGLDGLCWERHFETISRAELALREDGVYPLMDEASRAALREQVCLISRRSGLSEWTVARHAVRAAQGREGAQGSCCYFLYDDEGRRALMSILGAGQVRLPRIVPDPSGKRLMSGYGLLALLIFWALWALAGRWYLLIALLLLAWRFAVALGGAAVTRLFKPRPLLKMEFEALPADARTLVVMPALLTSAQRARELAGQLETLGALDRDENVEYLLLGDFRDAPAAREEGDEEIADAARQAIEQINRRSGSRRFHYLHRSRVYCARDDRFMGHERKRGALMALNQLLLGGDSLFEQEEECAPLIRGRFSYVLTLDADTRMLPGTLHTLAGAARHPLNRLRLEGDRKKGYGVFLPRVELSAGNRFARLLGGVGGVDSYPIQASSAYQDVCGRGIYGGKGLYDLRAFSAALTGRIPDGTVLSHDLLEGALAGAALVGDVTVHDGFPSTLGGYLRRAHRWTRGDWQLLPFIFSRSELDVFSRFLMLDNLARSLSPASALWVMMLSMWTGLAGGVLAALIEPFLGVLTSLPNPGGEALRRALAHLALLPVEAVNQVDAAVRALYRMKVSKKNLLEWTPAADADRQGPGLETLPGRVMAILLVPVLFRSGWAACALGAGLLFATGASWMRALEKEPPRAHMTSEQVELMNDLARRTWRFFETHVPLGGPGLPPDNVQIDPPVGAARRTSPTNIGLYLVSCLAARDLGFITPEQLAARLQHTIDTLAGLPKWRGHLFNWYDIDTLEPLSPRYISTVDSGNLAACLLLVAAAVEGELGARMEEMARGMDFTALYDRPRKLFYIGYDAMSDRLSDAHYDLLASESRILSFTAIALGQVPVKHWFRLGRPRTGQALISWSGTLFEYLMPELFLRAPEGSLLWESNRAVVALEQKAHPGAWGVSESGFFAFDLQMNYQYRAFGLSALSLRGGSFDDVIAPYSSVLALTVDAQAALKNLRTMKEKGWMGDLGLYEAVDMDPARMPDGVKSRVVMSHMAHHQGMILAAVAGALTGGRLQRYYAQRPEMRALSMLLEEKPGRTPGRPRRARALDLPQRRPQQRSTRPGRPGICLPDGHLLYGGGATCFVTAEGDGFYRVNGVMAGRFREGLFTGEADGLYVHLKIDGKYAQLTKRVQFGEGEAQWVCRAGQVQARLVMSVSPEDGTLNQQVFLHNQGQLPAEIEVTGCFAVALCSQADMEAHPAFQNLFISAEAPAQGVLLMKRRPRRRGDEAPALVYKLTAPEGARHGFETDLGRLVGREGQLSDPQALEKEFRGEEGPAINPCAALRARFSLAPADQCQVVLSTAVCRDVGQAHELRARLSRDGAQRARLLAITQARAMLDFLSIDGATHHLLQRASAFLFYPGLRPAGHTWAGEGPGLGAQALWALGVSGDLPLMSVFVAGKEQLPLAREAARAHEFYRAMGVWCDLLLINDYGNDYMQPVRDQLRQLVERSHLRELEGQPGGVHMIEGQVLSPAQRVLLAEISALCFKGGTGSMCAQLRRMLNCPEKDKRALQAMAPQRPQRPGKRLAYNGYGGFAPGLGGYQIDLEPGRATPAAWCNILAGPAFGCLVSERGGMFLWKGNSRMERLTPWSGDGLREGFPLQLCLEDIEARKVASLLPVTPPAQAEHGQGYTRYQAGAEGLRWTLTLFVEPQGGGLCVNLSLENHLERPRRLSLSAHCDFLMGVQARDKRLTRVWGEDGLLLAQGSAEGVGYLALEDAKYADGQLILPMQLAAGGGWRGVLLLGWEKDVQSVYREKERFARKGGEAALKETLGYWNDHLTRAEIILPDPLMSAMLSRFLPYQALAGRVYARAGLYQAGGAYGFRDQLQDLLCLMPIAPRLTRAHLMTCAARQFEDGDVLHWWHEPALGVRTRISDDLLFLPYVTACYVREMGERAVLEEEAPYLKDVALPADKEDLYAVMETGEKWESLHLHCLRAIRRAARTGPNGLPLMGSGDWNDGMNRVEGESVWLGEFLSVVARLYAQECCQAPEEKEELLALSARMLSAVEESGWGGAWYRRAFFRDGQPMGASGCRIDVIAQGWAAVAGTAPERARSAMNQAWDQLADQRLGIIKLLTPPFGDEGPDPGYIAAYPPGVRENGGQYTHGACWGVMGWARLGQAERAWRALEMLMPYTHALNREAADRYRVEPYVAAADVYGEPPLEGRGGWTWYTGAAGWLYRVALTELMGYERRGDKARLRALLPPQWNEASVRIKVGRSHYTLTARREAAEPQLDGTPLAEGWITLEDDGKDHQAVFPARVEEK